MMSEQEIEAIITDIGLFLEETEAFLQHMEKRRAEMRKAIHRAILAGLTGKEWPSKGSSIDKSGGNG